MPYRHEDYMVGGKLDKINALRIELAKHSTDLLMLLISALEAENEKLKRENARLKEETRR